MKTQKIFNILLVLSTLLLIAGCTQESTTKHHSTEQIWLVDITDPLELVIDTAYVHTQLDIENTLWEAKTISLSTITDYYNNPQKTFTIEEATPLMSNTHIRRAKVNNFIRSIDSAIVALSPSVSSTKNRSLVFTTIYKHLQHLSHCSATKRTLYIYSNLMENSPSGVSFYNKATYKKLTTHPDKVAEQLQKEGQLPDLTGITIYLLYYPNSTEDNERYHTIATFYTHLLEQHHATVHLSTSQ